MVRAMLLAVLCCAACGPSDVPVSNQTLCTQLGTAICTRADVCTSANGSTTQCASQFVKGCCSPQSCGQSSRTVYLSQLQECATEIAGFDCDQIGSGHLPPSCPSAGPY